MGNWNITNLSQIEFFRIEAEFYQRKFTTAKQNAGDKKLKSYGVKVIHPAEVKRVYSLNGTLQIVLAQNVRDNVLDWTTRKFMDQSLFNQIGRNKLQEGDVLVTRSGANYGQTSVITIEPEETNLFACADVLILKPGEIGGALLSTYLNVHIGKLLMIRGVYGAGQPHVAPSYISNISFPEFLIDHKTEIESTIYKSRRLQKLSETLNKQATDLLNKELGLNDIVFENKKSYTAKISEVIDSRRMNAEYFSPSIKLILKQPFLEDSSPLSAIFQIIRGATPSQYYKEGVPVLKTKNVRLPEIDMEKVQDYVLSTSGLVTIEENDLLLASMGVGSLGRMSFIHEIDQKSIVDGTIRILRKKKTTSRNYEIPTLLFLSSKVGQELIYRGIVGSTGIISLPDDYLYRIPIPKFTQEFCDNVTTLVKQSIDAKRESKRLLEQAKLRVEQLIEEAANKQ